MNTTTTTTDTEVTDDRPLGLINVSAGVYAPHPATGVMHFTEWTGAWGRVDRAIAYVLNARREGGAVVPNAVKIVNVTTRERTVLAVA